MYLQIEEAVTSEPEPVPKAEPAPQGKMTHNGKEIQLDSDGNYSSGGVSITNNQSQNQEAHAKKVRSEMAPNAKRPEAPKNKREEADALFASKRRKEKVVNLNTKKQNLILIATEERHKQTLVKCKQISVPE